jgi:predicted ribosome quality control (RQC) complex YloA/Tae2 family protein
MGRRSNIILTNDTGRILDAVKRVSPEMSRVRPIRPGGSYVPPPAQEKADPMRATPESVIAAARNADEPLGKWLVARFLGVSPATAGEVAVRAGIDPERRAGDLDDDEARRLAIAIVAVFEPMNTGRWRPIVYRRKSRRADFFATRMRSIEPQDDVTAEECRSIFVAAEIAWDANQSAVAIAPLRHAARRDRLLAEIDDARDRVRQRLLSLAEQSRRAEEAEHLREAGEAIYAWISEIRPGMTEYVTPEGLAIALDPTLGPSQNAQEYFERYRKARSAVGACPGQESNPNQTLGSCSTNLMDQGKAVPAREEHLPR